MATKGRNIYPSPLHVTVGHWKRPGTTTDLFAMIERMQVIETRETHLISLVAHDASFCVDGFKVYKDSEQVHAVLI